MDILLGHDSDTRPVYWNTKTDSHLAICGNVGSGKSVLARQVAHEALDNRAEVFILDDSKMGTDYRHVAMKGAHVATSDHIVLATLRYIKQIIVERISNFEAPQTPIIVIYDYYTTSVTRGDGDEGTEMMRLEKKSLAENILRIGRAVNVHGVLVSNHFPAHIQGRNITSNASVVGMGALPTRMRTFMLGDDAPALSPRGSRGTGVFAHSLASNPEYEVFSVPFRE